jgi:putative CocE/NonD family hydrolase
MKSLAEYILGRPFTSTRKDWDEVTHRLATDAMPVIEREIPLRDGLALAADVYLPAEWDRPAPAIVLGTPFDKRNPVLFEPEARFYQRNGYAVVVFDVRGRGKSDGQWRAFVNDARDTYDVIEWAAAQPWCTGAVGTSGISYGGWFQWAAASEHPPHLRCMVSTAAGGRWMQEIPYTYGVFQLYFVHWVFGTRRRILDDHGQVNLDDRLMTLPVGSMLDGLAEDSATWRDLMEHDTLDSFWQELRFEDEFARIDVPCLHVAGWYDMEDILGAFHFYEKMIECSPARDLQWLMVGPWTHVNTRFPANSYGGVHFGPDALIPMDETHLRFFDHWLKGIETGLLDEPRVRLFETGTNTWRTAGNWHRHRAQRRRGGGRFVVAGKARTATPDSAVHVLADESCGRGSCRDTNIASTPSGENWFMRVPKPEAA